MKTSLLPVVLWLLAGTSALAQPNSTPFTDNEPKPDTRGQQVRQEGDFAYVAGYSSSECELKPMIAKVHIATGNVVWSTLDKNIPIDNNDFQKEFYDVLVTSDAIYATFGYYDAGQNRDVWKLNKNDGSLIWIINSDGPYGYGIEHLYEFGPDKLLLRYVNVYKVIDRLTGETVSTYSSPDWFAYVGMASDQTIYAMQSNKLIKIVNADFDNPVDVVTIPTASCGGLDGYLITAKMISNSRLLTFTANSECTELAVTLIDLDNKTIIWQKKPGSAYSTVIPEVIVRNNKIYFTNHSPYVGGTFNDFGVHKMDLTTGASDWAKPFSFTNIFPGVEGPLVEGASQGLVVDASGDIYVSAVANTEQSPGDLAVMKISGTNGTRLAEKIITEDVNIPGKYNVVHGLYQVGNDVWLAGTQKTGMSTPQDGNPTVLFAKIDPTTLEPLVMNRLYGRKVEDSYDKQFVAYGTDRIVLGQRGRRMSVKRIDRTGNIVWEKLLLAKGDYKNSPGKMVALSNGNIAVVAAARSYSESYYTPNVTTTSPVFVLNAQGEVIKQFRFDGMAAADILADGDIFYVSFDGTSGRTIYKCNSSGLIASKGFRLPADYSRAPGSTDNYMSLSSTGKIYLVRSTSSQVAVDKNTLDVTENPIPLDGFTRVVTDQLIVNDTLFFATWQGSCCTGFPLMAWSQATGQYLYKTQVSGPPAYYYQKLVEGEPGYLYGFGVKYTQDNFVHKINRKTGAVVLSMLYENTDRWVIKDMTFDKTQKKLFVTGYKIINSKKKAVVMTMNSTGLILPLDVTNDGIGMGITVLDNNQVMVGGMLENSTCSRASMSFLYDFPVAPLNVTATKTLIDRITVSWTPAGASSKYFLVTRATEPDPLKASVTSGWITGNTYSDLSADIGKTYYYFVFAASMSNGMDASTGWGGPVEGLRVYNLDNFAVTASDGTSYHHVKVQWPVVEHAVGYRVVRSPITDPATEVSTDWMSSNSYLDTEAAPGVKYTYKAIAKSEFETFKESSTDVGFRRLTKPVIASISDGTVAGKIEMSWNAVEGATLYRVYRNSVNKDSTAAISVTKWSADRSFADTKVTIDKEYFYYVRATSDTINGTNSFFSAVATGKAKADDVPPPVTGVPDETIGISLYPTYTTGIVHIESASPVDQLSVMDALGRTVDCKKDQRSIDLTGHAAGLYIVHGKSAGRSWFVRVVRIGE